MVDARTNTLFVQDTPSRLEDVRRLIAKIDVPVRQVMIEARIVEASDYLLPRTSACASATTTCAAAAASSARRPNGPRFSVGGELERRRRPAGGGAQGGTPSFIPGSLVEQPAGRRPQLVHRPGSSRSSCSTARLTRFLNLEISALEADGKGKIIASPRVLTADQVEALIEQGTEIPYQQATSSGATAVSFRKANLSLKVKPQITPDGNVIMTLDVNKDQPGATTPAGVQINTKHVKTEVLVENGGTVVIGGIYEQNDRTDITKVPFFGDLPFVGFLFRNNTTTTSKTELLVFITPRIVTERLTVR